MITARLSRAARALLGWTQETLADEARISLTALKRLLGLSDRTLEKHRTYGTGPAYRKLGGRVVYAVEDLQAWADRGIVTSTSDPRGGVLPAKRQNPLPPSYGGRSVR